MSKPSDMEGVGFSEIGKRGTANREENPAFLPKSKAGFCFQPRRGIQSLFQQWKPLLGREPLLPDSQPRWCKCQGGEEERCHQEFFWGFLFRLPLSRVKLKCWPCPHPLSLSSEDISNMSGRSKTQQLKKQNKTKHSKNPNKNKTKTKNKNKNKMEGAWWKWTKKDRMFNKSWRAAARQAALLPPTRRHKNKIENKYEIWNTKYEIQNMKYKI